MRKVFKSETSTDIPLLPERVKNLNQTGGVLVERYANTFLNVVKSCNQSAQMLLATVVEQFPCFCDVATFCGTKVSFHKRAQILIADIWACFEGKDLGNFIDIETLTMFADYLVPRGLQFFNVLEYSDSLHDKLTSGVLIPNGGELEVEIRGCSVHAVELICNELQKLQKDRIGRKVVINSILVDFFLWDYIKSHEDKMQGFPIHKTRSIFY